jgi:hypothetical protein
MSSKVEFVRPLGHLESEDELSLIQLRTLTHLLEGASRQRIAGLLQIEQSTIAGWLSEPAFRSAYQAGLRNLRADLSTRAVSGAHEAIDVVRAILRDPEAAPSVRLQAAKTLLDRIDQKTVFESPDLAQRPRPQITILMPPGNSDT